MAPGARVDTSPERDADRPAKRHKTGGSIDFAEHLSEEGRLRLYPSLRKIVCQFAGSTDVIPMHGGLPPPDSFPITGLQLKLSNGQSVDLQDHNKSLHHPPGQHEVLLTNGSNHTFEIVCELLLERGDYILCEEYTYPSVIESVMLPKGYKALAVDLDQNGILPESLEQVISEHAASGRKPPRVLYTVPTGQNPTGMVTSLDRKKRIYEICSEHDIVIIEDDPCFYLQYSLEGDAYGFEGLGETYLSMDVDSRVIRLDTFSKFLAPGIRLGWATCHPDMLEKICFSLHASTIGPCSFTQVMIAEVLTAWGHAGLVQHLKKMQVDYKKRAAIVQEAAEKHLSKYAEWQAPRAGMFLWLKLKHIDDFQTIFEDLKQANVVVVPGSIAHCGGPDINRRCPFVRVSFATAAVKDLAVGISRLGDVLQKASEKQVHVQEEEDNSITTATTMF